MELTITEALQEIKTIGNRLLKKRASIAEYVGRDSRLRDPFEAQGGSEKFIKETMQSIADLEHRMVSIRVAVQKANLEKSITVNGDTRTVAEWLTWRKELSNPQKMHLNGLYKVIQQVRKDLQNKGGKVVATASAQVNINENVAVEFVLSIDEKELLEKIENLENILGSLDGRLSLFNATTTIELP